MKADAIYLCRLARIRDGNVIEFVDKKEIEITDISKIGSILFKEKDPSLVIMVTPYRQVNKVK